MRKLSLTLSIILIIIFFASCITAYANNKPGVSADGMVLMDGQTGQVVFSKNPDAKYPPASTTKIMTALLTLENCSLDDKVMVSKTAADVDPASSRAGIRENEELTVKDLLYGLLFVSGNDCAVALADHIGGTVDDFVKMMNKRAEELGCKNTNFVNPSGLYDDQHRTSAMDLALIMRELVKHPEYTKIATDPVAYSITPSNVQDIVHKVSNENKMICYPAKYHLDGFEGGKTGYTIQSLHSYVASASRNGQRFIVSWLHSNTTTHYEETIVLLNYAFENFETKKLYSKGDVVSDYKISSDKTIPLKAAEDFYYVKDKNSNETPQIKISETMSLLSKSFKKGDQITEASVILKDETVGTLKLISGEDSSKELAKLSKSTTVTTAKPNIFLSILKALFMMILFFFGGIFTIRFFVKRRRRKRKKAYIMNNFRANR